MLCYKDQTFCTFFADCAKGDSCFRAYNDAEKKRNYNDLPVSQFSAKPECHEEKK